MSSLILQCLIRKLNVFVHPRISPLLTELHAIPQPPLLACKKTKGQMWAFWVAAAHMKTT